MRAVLAAITFIALAVWSFLPDRTTPVVLKDAPEPVASGPTYYADIGVPVSGTYNVNPPTVSGTLDVGNCVFTDTAGNIVDIGTPCTLCVGNFTQIGDLCIAGKSTNQAQP